MAVAGGKQLPCGGGAVSITFTLQLRLPLCAAPAAMPNARGQRSGWAAQSESSGLLLSGLITGNLGHALKESPPPRVVGLLLHC